MAVGIYSIDELTSPYGVAGSKPIEGLFVASGYCSLNWGGRGYSSGEDWDRDGEQ
ncbi:hypothetical protein [Burkholderia thailandensis]|uniref:hypothetical protein n=1 Tax=Burkholderia thailandensis TaxID=57975 RepID=UPI0012FE6A43|nr:hypothetical protein [Burkholderia thailandensis]